MAHRPRGRRRLGRQLRFETLCSRRLLAVATNPGNAFDVNDDLRVTAADALTIINQLSRRPARMEADAGGKPVYLDVSGDGTVTALDALAVVNAIAKPSRQVTIRLQNDPAEYGGSSFDRITHDLSIHGTSPRTERPLYFWLDDNRPTIETLEARRVVQGQPSQTHDEYFASLWNVEGIFGSDLADGAHVIHVGADIDADPLVSLPVVLDRRPIIRGLQGWQSSRSVLTLSGLSLENAHSRFDSPEGNGATFSRTINLETIPRPTGAIVLTTSFGEARFERGGFSVDVVATSGHPSDPGQPSFNSGQPIKGVRSAWCAN